MREVARLSVRAAGSEWSRERRGEALRALEAGELRELEFEAVVFRAGPNRNHLRIRSQDLPAFAESFVGVPFLRDHRVEEVEARAGIVVESALLQGVSESALGRSAGRSIRQRIRLTTQRDVRAFLEGQIDRFSVAWFYDGVLCSVCGKEWGGCQHKPGRAYHAAGDRTRLRCELVFVKPVGKEVSAVNAPAVEGTGLLGVRFEGVGARVERFGSRVPNGEGVMPSKGKGSGMDGFTTVFDASGKGGRMNQTVLEGAGNGAVGANLAVLDEGSPLAGGIQQIASAVVDMDRSDGDAWLAALRTQVVDGLLLRSGLSSGGMTAVRTALAGDGALTPQRVQAVVDAQRAAEAALSGGRGVVRGLAPNSAITSVRSAEEEVQGALNWLLGDVSTPTPAPHLRNLRDIYLAITGDVNFWGVFNPDHARLTSANSNTLTAMAVNALNKAVMLHYDNLLTYRWYESIVHVLPHDGTTQPLQLIHMDGIAALPAVSEGAAYTEATTGDSKESASFSKFGAYVGITLEMIRRSEIARIQAIPRLLVQAAIRRRSATVAAVFTGNPTLADDSTTLFHNNHGNSDTTAFGAAAWEAARTRIFEQTAPGTGKPLALWPTYCLTPIELYDDALTLFGYGSGDVGKPNSAGTAQEPNVYAMARPGDPRPIPIVVPEWTDATDWAYIVDPRLHPVLVMAYANATAGGVHALPEIFEVRSESAGLMFSNDVLPVKIRDWWAFGVATHVGIGRNAVAG